MTSKAPTIAVFTKNRSNPAYAAARLGADRTALRLGARTVHFVPAKPDNIEEQIALIDEALAQRPDAIVLVPVHPTAVNGAIRKIGAAGVPLIGCLNQFTETGPLTYVGADDHSIGVKIGTYLCENLGGRGKLVILEGAPQSVTSVARVHGFREALKNFPDVRVVATLRGDYLREPARHAAEAFLASGVAFDAVFAANDDMALGMIAALEAAGSDSVIVGVNAIPEAIAAIKRGKLLATIDFDAMKISAIATEAALRHLRGEVLPSQILLPVQVVDRTNYAHWDMPFEERPLMEWKDAVS